MQKTKIFLVKKGDEIPPIAKSQTLRDLNFSDWYFAKCLTIGKEESISIACYDFKYKRWSILSSGKESVIEYYVFDEKFDKWANSQMPNTNLLSELFDAMDNEDKI
jgi:hypothetical protein